MEDYEAGLSKFEEWKMGRSVSDGGLRGKMKDTKQTGIMRIFKRSKFNKSAYERDKIAIIEAYNAVGMRDAVITKDTMYDIDSKHVGIDIYIDKGDKYYFGDISWVGNTKYRNGQLDTLLGIKKGDVYNELKARMDERAIRDYYLEKGYTGEKILSEIIENESNGILVAPGKQEEFAKQLNTLMHNEDKINQFSSAAYQLRDVLNEEKIMQQWEQLINKIVSQKK